MSVLNKQKYSRITAKHHLSCKLIIFSIQTFYNFIKETKEAEKKTHCKHVYHGDFLIKTLIHISLEPVFAEVEGLTKCWIDVFFKLNAASIEGDFFFLPD